jgi:hypothetical protein
MKNTMKKICKSLGLILISLVLGSGACSTPDSKRQSSKELSQKHFKLEGKWEVYDVKFTGDPYNIKVSKEINLYALLGSNWKETKGKYFYFEPDGHWSTNAFEINKDALTYSFTDSLVLAIKNDQLDYQFTVPITDSTNEKMTWDIGNDIKVFFTYKGR